jgi:arylsulfatase A-like enzyme
VIVVVLDGLRPDAIDAFDLANLRELSARGAYTPRATTVSPSVTAAAMTSLLTGVPPTHHGLVSDRFHIPHKRGPLDPLPAVLDRAGLPVSTFIRTLPLLFRPLARASAKYLGVKSPTFRGYDARSILAAARSTLREQRNGLILLHWPDADRAGHEHGWMSPRYGAGCRALDETLGALVREAGVLDDPDTLLIALADHGGGGVVDNDHDGDHPWNLTIPVLMLGAGIDDRWLDGPVSILDIAPTVVRALGVAAPPSWPGRPCDVFSETAEHVA